MIESIHNQELLEDGVALFSYILYDCIQQNNIPPNKVICIQGSN